MFFFSLSLSLFFYFILFYFLKEFSITFQYGANFIITLPQTRDARPGVKTPGFKNIYIYIKAL